MDRRYLGFLLAAITLVAAVAALLAYNRERQEQRLALIEVNGSVEIDSPRGEVKARAGTPLTPEDRVKTGTESRAILGLGQKTRIRIGESSSVQVVSVDEEGVRLELEQGTLQATVRPESGAVRVGNGGREVQSTSGRFAFAVNRGLVAAEAIEGDLMLQGMDELKLEAGSRATIEGQRATVGPIPEDLLLAVDWPEVVPTRERTSRFDGRTTPGALVVIVGQLGTVETTAGPDGRFTAKVALAEGENDVRVVARDLFGKEVSVTGSLQILRTQATIVAEPPEYPN